jgi:Protein of unknown function DUF262/Protein of unknown function (DUF1524)
MHTAAESMREVFHGNTRFVIPRFQRRYAWTEDQWEPLWDDIVAAFAKFDGTGDVPRHFLGAIVVNDAAWAPGVHDVVDGQQRLTTLQLLFGAVAAVARASKAGDRRDVKLFERQVVALERLVVNAGPTSAVHTVGSADERLKVWPSRNDQAAFRSAMTVHVPARGSDWGDPPVLQAYDYFAKRARGWLSKHRNDASAFEKLVAVLSEGLYAVVIRLEAADDPQVVFQRLNAQRLPLRASDFVRNHLFALAQSRGLPADWLYDQHWAQFDGGYWVEPPTRNGRPRIDEFLSHFLVMETKREFPSQRLFGQFAEYLAGTRQPLDAVMARIAGYGEIYRRLDTLTDLDGAEREFMGHLRLMDITTMNPVLLRLFGDFGVDERHAALRILDSYLVRRMIVGAPTNDYGGVAAQLLRGLDDPKRAAEPIAAFLSTRETKSSYWPRDRELTHIVNDTPIGTSLQSYRLRMVLKIIDSGLHDALVESVDFDAGKLTVEHLLPVAWSDNWPLNGESAASRNANVHTLGNLALVTDELNRQLGNRAWSVKLPLIRANSGLRLNQQLDEEWTVPALRARGRRLALALCSALVAPTGPAKVAQDPPETVVPEQVEPDDAEPPVPGNEAANNEAAHNEGAENDPPAGQLGPPRPPTSPLAVHFGLQVARLYPAILEQLDHRASRLLELVNQAGALSAARQLLSEPQPSDATLFVLGRGRPELSVEAVVVRAEFAALFTPEELARARDRLT